MENKLISISEAAKKLSITPTTMRRWDKSGQLKAIRLTPRGKRLYRQEDIELLLQDIFTLAKKWVVSQNVAEPDKEYFCPDGQTFQSRLNRLERDLQNTNAAGSDFSLITSIVGEIGNNSFDHNLGNWPTKVSGCIIAAQHYPNLKKIDIAVGDPGVGFYGSLKAAFPEIKTDLDAIRKGLEGNSGRIGETRGNGLRIIQQWTIQNFFGKVMIHSGNGLVIVSNRGMKEYTVNKILGTLAQFVINYKNI